MTQGRGRRLRLSSFSGWAVAAISAALVASLAGCGGAPSPAAAVTPTRTASPSPTIIHPPTATAVPTSTTAPDGPKTFVVVPGETTARFRIEERLRNRPNTVVGKTNGVSGEITVDPREPGGAVVGPIVIDAGDFATDNEFRDSSIRGLILESAAFPAITFVPTAIVGLPEAVEVGDRLAFDVTGDLTIRHVTRSETFRVVLEVVAADRVEGEAEATIRRADYELSIPSVEGVAEVGDEVELSLKFTALAEP